MSLFSESNISPLIKFLNYGQSNRVVSKNDRSVSYATAIINI